MHSTLRKRIRRMADQYPVRTSALLPGLCAAQEANGGAIRDSDLREIADLLGVSRAHAYGVATYYSMFRLQPIGKYHLEVDCNLPAMLAGADDVLERLRQRLGIDVGQSTGDGLFTLSTVEDLGSCGTCPVLQVNGRLYENLTPEKVDVLLEHLRRGVMPDWPAEANFATECNVLLRRRGKPNSTALETYVADGGYKGLEKALAAGPEAVVAAVKDAYLRGRGGAGFPTAVKWGFVPKNGTKPVYLICNADEGEPGTFKDRQIMEFDPHLLLEGMAIAGYAVGAKRGFVYIRGEFGWIADILERAIAEARKAGMLGKRILRQRVEFEVTVHRGAGSYICGEETALIESLQGNRGCPRIRPPFPAEQGLYGCPTVVNNVETLACVPFILEHGAAAFRQMGTPNNSGPKIFGVSGHVHRPGAYEFPLGTPLQKVLDAAGGVRGRLKAVIVGGISTPILTAPEAANLTLDYDSCVKHGTLLGSGGIIVMNDTVSIPRVALRTIEFYAHESCGQCTPCREGTRVLLSLLHDVVAGRGSREKLAIVRRLAGGIRGTTLCPGGDAASMALGGMLAKFPEEFDALCAESPADAVAGA